MGKLFLKDMQLVTKSHFTTSVEVLDYSVFIRVKFCEMSVMVTNYEDNALRWFYGSM